jgi:dihydrodipicolinate synthase/N-acetylneuraminate lyase
MQVLAGAFALGFDSAIATSLNMLPRANIKILEAMRNSRPSEALQEQRKLSQAINVITRNGMCLRDRLLALCKVRGTRLARVVQGSILWCYLISWDVGLALLLEAMV